MLSQRTSRVSRLSLALTAVGLVLGGLVLTAGPSGAATATWTVQTVAPTVGLLGISCPTATVCVAVGRAVPNQGVAYSTTNGGVTWTALTLPVGTRSIYGISCPSATTCFAVGGTFTGGFILKTTDGGATWDRQAAPAGQDFLSGISCPSTSNCVAVVGVDVVTDKSVLITTDGGSTWTSIATPTGSAGGSVSCPSTANCVTESGDVSTDGGSTWTKGTVPTTSTAPTAVSCGSISDCVIVSAGSPAPGQAFYSQDGGASWAAGQVPSEMKGLTTVSCTTALTCVAVGSGTLRQGPVIVDTLNGGKTWSAQPIPSGVTTLGAVSCLSGASCRATGWLTDGEAVVLSGPVPVAPTPAVLTTSLPSGTVGAAYAAQLQATSGVLPYAWAVVAGSLPAGLSLDSTGAISGTPATSGTSSFTVQVTDGADSTATADLSLTIDPASAPSPPSPAAGCSSTGVGSVSFPGGYWLAEANGAVYSCGDAPFYGSLVTLGVTPAKPIVGIAATPDDQGYWLVASDGGIFAFGDAQFYGSMGGRPLNEPVVGIAPSAQGGYYEVASDGGLFAFGPGATFHGSMGGQPLNKPVVGMALTPQGGYYEVASDGGVFSFGAPFHGSTGCLQLVEPIVAIQASPDTSTVGAGTACGLATPQAPGGYQFVAADGGVFSFGNAVFAGSLGGQGVTDVVGMVGA